MYVPPFQYVSDVIEFDKSSLQVKMPKTVFDMLLRSAIAAHFDARWYRSAYPDVADSVERGEIRSEIAHYVESGYREGRLPCSFPVHEEWYKIAYPDVAQAIDAGEVASAHAHYNQSGYAEGRFPDAASAAVAELWTEAKATTLPTARSRSKFSR